MKSRVRLLVVSASMVVAAAVGSVAALDGVQAGSPGLWSERKDAPAQTVQVPNFATIAAQVQPAVVSISVEQTVKNSSGRGLPPGMQQDPRLPDFFRFFGGQPHSQQPQQGMGTGFFIREDGLILTNYHVVENADRIEVSALQEDGTERTLEAEVVGTAPEYDVALLRTKKPANAEVAYLGTSSDLQIGEWVMAVGNPFGLSHSVSVGIISAKGRRDIAPSGRRGIYNFLQTDASINPGNSGGPLLNMRGEVIGINSAINAAGQGIGFAIPIDMVKAMLPELSNKGSYSRSWIGVSIQPVSGELAQSFGLERARGALVANVVADSPAAKAGVREGDIILSFDGNAVNESSDLPLYASMAGVGSKKKVELWRDGKKRGVTVVMAAFPSGEAVAQGAPSGQKDSEVGSLGLALVETDEGVSVRGVKPGSAAARAGLMSGDLLVSVNGNSVRAGKDVQRGVSAVESGDILRLKILRRGSPLFVALKRP